MFIWWSKAYAQDYTKLLNVINRVEARLDSLTASHEQINTELHVMNNSDSNVPGVHETPLSHAPSFLGFFDISASGFSERANPWFVGPFELDLEYSYGEDFAGGGAFVFEDGSVELGVAFFDYHKFNKNISPRGRIFSDPGIHVQVGRFDIPFGLDYFYFAAPDRETITPPLITDYIMDGGWNDTGMRIYGTHSFVDFSAFTVNGFNEGLAYGGRLGFFPMRDPYTMHRQSHENIIQFGISYAVVGSKRHGKEETLIGYDIESVMHPLEFRTEYIKRKNSAINNAVSGYYVTGRYALHEIPAYFIVNYGELKRENETPVRRLLTGFTFEVRDYSAFKFEHVHFFGSNYNLLSEKLRNNTVSAKLVLTF